ncbi:MAG TPA: hypothetical protein VK404_04125 [Spirosoma sp.]|nr:hypothetical protein [Spirosoma sp.]
MVFWAVRSGTLSLTPSLLWIPLVVAKRAAVQSNRMGLTNIAAKYRLLNQPDIIIHQTETTFQVTVPLLKPVSA